MPLSGASDSVIAHSLALVLSSMSRTRVSISTCAPST